MMKFINVFDWRIFNNHFRILFNHIFRFDKPMLIKIMNIPCFAILGFLTWAFTLTQSLINSKDAKLFISYKVYSFKLQVDLV
jgi:uncharacterized membrane protein YczE